MAKERAKRAVVDRKLMGKEVLLYLNYGESATEDAPQWTLIGGQTTANLDMSADDIDASDKNSSGWGETEAGLKTTELSLEGIICNGDEGYAALKDAFIKGEPVDICRYAADGTADRNWYSITELSMRRLMMIWRPFPSRLRGLGPRNSIRGWLPSMK